MKSAVHPIHRKHVNRTFLCGMTLLRFMVALFSMTSLAKATPPDVYTLKDHLFGISENHVFFMRTTQDNHGSYTMDTQDTLLVAVHRETGKQTQWHVYRTTQNRLKTPSVTRTQSFVNPYSVLASHHAITIDPTQADNTTATLAVLNSTHMRIAYPDHTLFELNSNTLLAQQYASLKTTASTLPTYARFHTTSHHKLIKHLTDIPLTQCQLATTSRIHYNQHKPVTLAQISCHEYDMAHMELMRFYVVVPQKEPFK